MLQHRTLAHAIARWARVSPDAPALIFLSSEHSREHVTFGRLHADALTIATRLRRQGVAPGDVVVLAAEHDYPSVATLVATFYAGAVPAVYPYVSSYHRGPVYRERLAEVMRGLGARTVLAAPGFPRDVAGTLVSRGCRVLPVEVPQAVAAETDTPHETDPASPAYIQFSSGTTGEPTGAVISHRAALHHADACARAIGLRDGDLMAGWLPLNHDLGLSMQLLLSLVTGRVLVTLAPRLWVRQPLLLLKAVSEYRATLLVMPNFGYEHTTRVARDRDLEGIDLGSLRWLATGGELVQASTLERFTARFADCGLPPNVFAPGYGLAECTSGIVVTPRGRGYRVDRVSRRLLLTEKTAAPVAPTDPDTVAIVGCGVPFPGVTVTIVDDEGTPLPERRIGEFVVEAPFNFDGYQRRPDLTSAVLRDGRVFTGDLGYRVGDEIFLVDRKKDLIVSAGANIFPGSLERVVRDAVGDPAARVAAFGVHDETAGTELPVVVCETRGHADASVESGVMQRARHAVEDAFDVPLADVVFVPRGWIVKTTSGKIARRATREKYLESRPLPARGPAMTSAQRLAGLVRGPASRGREVALEAAVRSFCEERLGHAPLGRDDDFFSIGCDSIRVLQLLLEVEQATGRPLPVQDVLQRPSIACLLECLSEEEPQVPSCDAAPQTAAASPRRTTSRPLSCFIRRQILRVTAGWGWVQRRRFPEHVAVVRAMLREVGDGADEPARIRSSVIGNVFAAWRRQRPEIAGSWPTRISGFAHVRDTLRNRQPAILLLSHTVGYEAVLDLLAEQAVQPVVVGRAGTWRPSRAATGLDDDEEQIDPRLRTFTSQLHQAVHGLRQGGVVVMAGDGHHGRTAIELPFAGRRRRFGSGFAELAMRTGAVVFPVFTRVEADGVLQMEVQQPLARPDASDSSATRTLVHQYVDRLWTWWSRYPESVLWREVGRFVQLPRVSSASP